MLLNNYKIRYSLTRFFLLFLAVFSAFILARVIEFLYLYFNHFVENKLPLLFNGLLNDFPLSVAISILFYPGVFLFNRLIHKLSIVLISFVLLINSLLTFYFLEVLEPLDNSLFKHSIDEVFYIIKEFGTFNYWQLLIPFPILLFAVITYKIFPIQQVWKTKSVTISIVLVIFISFFPTSSRGDYAEKEKYYVSSNKLSYFLINSVLKKQDLSILPIDQGIDLFQQTHPKSYLSKKFPLLHKDTTLSTIAPFFNLKETPPNLVFIIVESLSAAYSGSEAKALSFTPFLDSLEESSLSFTNFLSVGERTFSVLPSVFGSLPHGDRGFVKMEERMPNHYSFLKLLSENGYANNAFFYGGYAHYSYYDVFMKLQGVSAIYEQKEYNYEGTGKVLSVDDIPFGVDDSVLFDNAIHVLDSIGSQTPYVHTYLTLSMHAPFTVEGQEKYIERVKKQITGSPDEARYKKIVKALSTICYTDEMLRLFFERYKKRAEFENTIFIITGDHRISKPSAANAIDTYHVPLYIYSPLLKRTKKMKGVNTHLDIAPALTKLMLQAYGFKGLDAYPWMGYDFDTSAVFNCSRSIEFMLNNRFVEQYLHKAIFYDYGKVFQVKDRFRLEAMDEKSNKQIVEEVLEIKQNTRLVSKYVVDMNKVSPDSATFETLECDSTSNLILVVPIDQEYTSVYDKTLNQSYSKITLQLEMKLLDDQVEQSISQPNFPLFILAIHHKDQSEPYWQSFELEKYMVNKEGSIELIINQELGALSGVDLKEGDQVKLYFWDNKQYTKELTFNISKLCIVGKS